MPTRMSGPGDFLKAAALIQTGDLDFYITSVTTVEQPTTRRKDTRNRHAYYLENKEKVNSRAIAWAKNNPEKRKKIVERYHINNPGAFVAHRLRSRIWTVIKKNPKHFKYRDVLGCTNERLVDHLASKFQEGMSWENYGEWHIDHIRPCASFDLSDPEQQKQCFHYTNLQPLWATENKKKYAKY